MFFKLAKLIYSSGKMKTFETFFNNFRLNIPFIFQPSYAINCLTYLLLKVYVLCIDRTILAKLDLIFRIEIGYSRL